MATDYTALPIFPLPRLVMMPGSLLPLHVFEQRYRALVRHCMQTDDLMGVATLVAGDAADVPAIHPEIGVGRLVRVKPFPDGRSNIVLSYVETALLDHEIDTPHPFRVVAARGIDVVDGAVTAPAERLRSLVEQLRLLAPDAREELERVVGLSTHEMLDDLAVRLLESPDERRAYAGMAVRAERADYLVGHLAMVLARFSPIADA